MQIEPVRNAVIDGRMQPEGSVLAGYAALVHAFSASCPWPAPVSVVSDSKVRADRGRNHLLRDGFAVYERNYAVAPEFGAHLSFALKHEKADLLILKRVFDRVPAAVMEEFVRQAPTGGLRRQAWFLYEWLTGRRLDLPAADAGNYVDALDPKKWQTADPVNSPRHRVRDNMPGTPAFCPLVERSAAFAEPLSSLAERSVRAVLADAPGDLAYRLARRLLLKDSRSTFLIESENPSNDDLRRWSETVERAGEAPLTVDLMVGLQKELMRDRRFIVPGVRRGGVFLGEHVDGSPVPVWIGARPEDLPALMEGVVAADARMERSGVDPLAHAAAVGFGLVFAHPFEDGNGRIHRYLMQHVLARHGIRPSGVTLPLSKAIWEDVEGYHAVLSEYDRPRMPLIDWRATGNGNVEVVNDTADLYRFFDATPQALFLKRCMGSVLERTLPAEIEEMRRRDRFFEEARDVVDMPAVQMEKFLSVVLANGGVLSKAKRTKLFAALTDGEVEALEEAAREAYGLDAASPAP